MDCHISAKTILLIIYIYLLIRDEYELNKGKSLLFIWLKLELKLALYLNLRLTVVWVIIKNSLGKLTKKYLMKKVVFVHLQGGAKSSKLQTNSTGKRLRKKYFVEKFQFFLSFLAYFFRREHFLNKTWTF